MSERTPSSGASLDALVSLRAPLGRASSRTRRWGERALALALALVWIFARLKRSAGNEAVVHVRDDEVALVLDLARGRTRLVDSPGVLLTWPWFEQVLRFERAPREVVFGGGVPSSAGRVPLLALRGREGSSCWFEGLSLRYALLPGDAHLALGQLGGDLDRAHEFVHVMARAILRDVLGAFSPEELMDPLVLLGATDRVRSRLADGLAELGLTVLDVAPSKPGFDAAFEGVLERRRVAEQELTGLAGQNQVLRQEKEQLVQRARKEINVGRSKLQSQLASQRRAAEREAEKLTAEADLFFRQRTEEAKLRRQKAEIEAAAALEKIESEARGFQARLAALASQGDLAVRAALVERLGSIRFTFEPVPAVISLAMPSSQASSAKAGSP